MAASNNQEKKQQKGPGNGGQNGAPQGQKNSPNLLMQLAIAFAIFVAVSAGYSLYRQYVTTQNQSVPLSQIVNDIEAGKIVSVVVEGDQITATYTDKSVKM